MNRELKVIIKRCMNEIDPNLYDWKVVFRYWVHGKITPNYPHLWPDSMKELAEYLIELDKVLQDNEIEY